MDRPQPSLVHCSRAATAKSSMHHQKTSGLTLQPGRTRIEGVMGRVRQFPCNKY